MGKKKVGDLVEGFITFCALQRKDVGFLLLIESRDDKQVSWCSLVRAWERECVSGFVSAYLTNDRKITAAPVSWQQEWRAQMRQEEKRGRWRKQPYTFTHWDLERGQWRNVGRIRSRFVTAGSCFSGQECQTNPLYITADTANKLSNGVVKGACSPPTVMEGNKQSEYDLSETDRVSCGIPTISSSMHAGGWGWNRTFNHKR